MGATQKGGRLWGLVLRAIPPVLTLAIAAWLLSQISIRDVVDLLSNLSYPWVGIGLICYFITNVCRSFRLKILLPDQVTQPTDLVYITITQSMFNNILPARIGELSLVYLLNKYESVPLDRATVALILARVFDFMAVAAIFVAAALAILNDLPTRTATIIEIVSVVMVFMVLLMISAVQLGKQSLRLVQRILKRLRLGENHISILRHERLLQVLRSFEAVRSPKRQFHAAVWSFLVWFGIFAWFYAFLRSIGIQIAITDMVVGSTFAVLSKSIPFISVGGLGAHEAGWTAGFMLVGFDKTTAIASGFAVNILTMLSSVILGALATWRLRRTQSARDPESLDA